MFAKRTFRMAALGGALVIAAAACGYGETLDAHDVTADAATLTGTVHSTVAGPTDYWFAYGAAGDLDRTTPVASVDVDDTTAGYPVTATIDGLDPATVYHYRLCARSATGHGVCGETRSLTTAPDRRSVVGSGTVFSMPELGFAIAATIDVSQAPDGSDLQGHVSVLPGQAAFRLPDSGPVTCLAVSGNRAAVGFVAEYPDFPDAPDDVARLVFVEDNGTEPGRLSYGTIDAPATECPVPTDDDFVPHLVGGFDVGNEVPPGSFVVTDVPGAP